MLSEMSQKRKINTAWCDITSMWNLIKKKNSNIETESRKVIARGWGLWGWDRENFQLPCKTVQDT